MKMKTVLLFSVYLFTTFKRNSISAQMRVSSTVKMKSFFPYFNSKLNIINGAKSALVSKEVECCFQCTTEPTCLSYNFGLRQDSNGKHVCELLSADKHNSSQNFSGDEEFHHFTVKSPCDTAPCQNGGSCFPQYKHDDYVCECTGKYWGRNCHRKMLKSCADYKNAGYCTTGIYSIVSPDALGSFNVYCDMSPKSDGGGWTMAFKAKSGVSSPTPAEVWLAAGTRNEHVTSALDVSNSLNEHYKNRLVTLWTTFKPTSARLVLYETQKEKISLLFNATTTTTSNWFQMSRVQSSPWSDLQTQPKNRFTLHDTSGSIPRQFFINRNYGGCDFDAGWLIMTKQGCSWETRLPNNYFIYSKLTTYTNWNTLGNVGTADILVVYVR